MSPFTDQTGRGISVEVPARRIVSLVPSQTELLYSLGLEEQVVGITKFCMHPEEWFRSKARVGGTKQVNQDAIRALGPDLVLANKEENVKEQVEQLAAYCPVWVSDVHDIGSALDMMQHIGKLTDRGDAASRLVTAINHHFSSLALPLQRLRTAYFLWRNPYMTAGGDTFINAMLKTAGFDNIYQDSKRYPIIELDDLKENGCQLLLLSSEPYPFKQKHLEEIQQQLPGTLVRLVDGEYFSWYGSRMLGAADYFAGLRRSLE